MLQPYPGRQPLPPEGLVFYDAFSGKGGRLEKEYVFELSGLADRLVQLAPITKGWAVVGRTDKYLSAAAVEVLAADDRELKIKLIEAGPLAVWSGKGAPKAEGLEFTDAGNGLYKADLPVGERNRIVTLVR
jgi:hypothetical protein